MDVESTKECKLGIQPLSIKNGRMEDLVTREPHMLTKGRAPSSLKLARQKYRSAEFEEVLVAKHAISLTFIYMYVS